MAKIVNPPAELETHPDDVDLPLHLLSRLAPFSQLKQPPSLDKYPGACRLRFFRAGEAVCVHGEPGWSAFCFVPAADIFALRDYAANALHAGPTNREKAAAAVAKIAADHQALVDQLGQKDFPDTDKKDLAKKVDSCERELEKQQAALALLDEELAKLPAVRRQFDSWLKGQQPTDAEVAGLLAAKMPSLINEARRKADASFRASLDELATAPALRRRQIADLLEPAEPELARCLQALAAAEDGVLRVAVTRLPRLRTQPSAARGWLDRLRQGLKLKRSDLAAKPAFIPGDGPRDVDYRSRLCSIYEGELVGELSCLNRTPRSATVTMTRDGFVVELMRNILDLMSKDSAYLARVEAGQRQRLINSALRETLLFAGLPEADLARIADGMDFQSYKPGSLICDEHEEADCLFVIGNGIIKVVSGVSWLLPPTAVADSADFRREWKAAFAGAVPEPESVHALNRIIANASWGHSAQLRAVREKDRLAPIVWRMIAAVEYGDIPGLVRCNRLVLNALDSKSYPAPKAETAVAPAGYAVADFGADWKKLCSQLVADDKKPEDNARAVWDRLASPAQDLLRKGMAADLTPPEREAVIAALNALLVNELLLLTAAGSAVAQTNANLAGQLLPMLVEGQLWSDFDFQRWNRCLNRLLLEKLCPKSLTGLARPSGLPNIRAYCSRNEVIGEIALVEGRPRSATLVTYNHPKNDPKREAGPVHLFRISKAAIDEVLQRRPEIRKRLGELAARRRRADRQPLPLSGGGDGADRTLLQSPRGEQLGLVEGQKLMLIDLDRCTRCDECVRACVNTHDDGHSRLFLVGPRHGQFLVPATCRSCLDPVCMIGCPVNSIQRGDNKEIVIRDWCIGCSKCADQCPYGSIQMHDTGLVPAASHGWLFAPAPAGETWTQPNFDDAAWLSDATPFIDDPLLDLMLIRLHYYAPRGPVAFRRLFQIPRSHYHKDARLQLELTAPNDQARVWLNGVELQTDEKPRQGKRKYEFGPAGEFVKPGDNVLAALVPRPSQPTGQVLFSLRLDAEREADSAAVEIKLVTARAVVCDLCSSLPTGPACVRACPHEAAMRVNAVKG